MTDFFKGFNIRKGFNTKTFITGRSTVCVKHKDGHISEHHGITNPWRYVVKVKKNINVVSAWIKEE